MTICYANRIFNGAEETSKDLQEVRSPKAAPRRPPRLACTPKQNAARGVATVATRRPRPLSRRPCRPCHSLRTPSMADALLQAIVRERNIKSTPLYKMPSKRRVYECKGSREFGISVSSLRPGHKVADHTPGTPAASTQFMEGRRTRLLLAVSRPI